MTTTDDVPQPVDPEELVARVKALLRQATPRSAGGEEVLAVGDVVLDAHARTVRRGGSYVTLTGTEFALLRAFLRSAGSPRHLHCRRSIRDGGRHSPDAAGQRKVQQSHHGDPGPEVEPVHGPTTWRMRSTPCPSSSP
jgi:hypothetical protein